MKTRWKILTAALLVAVALGLGWSAFRPSPDVVGARGQNGFYLLDIQPVAPFGQYAVHREPVRFFGFSLGRTRERVRRDPNDTPPGETPDPENSLGLWMQLPEAVASEERNRRLPASAVASNGQRLSLWWHPVMLTAEADARRAFLIVPHGWPPSCRWLDVSVKDDRGHAAHWRLVNFPPAVRAFAPPPKSAAAFDGLGATWTLHAWRGVGSDKRETLNARLTGASKSSSVYELAQTQSATPEWGEHVGHQTGSWTMEMRGPHLTADLPTQTAWPRGNQWVQDTFVLKRREALRETLTIRSLRVKRVPHPRSPSRSFAVWDAPPQRLTTKSGIVVEVLPVPRAILERYGPDAPLLYDPLLALRVTPGATGKPTRLPRSPLCRRAGKPVTLAVSARDVAITEYAPDGILALRLPVKSVVGGAAILTLEQRATLGEQTVTLTAPVSAVPPPGVRL